MTREDRTVHPRYDRVRRGYVEIDRRAEDRSDRVHEFVAELFDDKMHARRVLSLGNAVVGAIHAAALGDHAIGKALATASGLEPKHATRQVDRLLSNMSLSVWEIFPLWVRFLLSERQEVFVALDWTDFDADTRS